MNKQTILEALTWRYAGKEFDTTKKVSDEDINTILEAGRLSPSSYGLEPWNFVVVKNPETREKLKAVSYNQPKVTDASHLVVITARTDAKAIPQELITRASTIQGKTKEELKGLSDMTEGVIGMKGEHAVNWFEKQTYIPLGIMIETAALLSVDSGPMEGFDANQVDEILGLKEKNLHAVSMLALGYRSGNDPYATMPKVRRSFEEAVTVIE